MQVHGLCMLLKQAPLHVHVLYIGMYMYIHVHDIGFRKMANEKMNSTVVLNPRRYFMQYGTLDSGSGGLYCAHANFAIISYT